ncbi:MAG TPA: hemerythrin domain-containing protein [Candidatus Melainabacteria bacterium]|nr:hemerythrin domain-containing protein [Candidatus Melainabacteria bacterium]
MAKKAAVSACELIRKDHDDIKKLLQKYDTASDAKERENIVRELGMQLTEHARMDEELIYPAAAQMAEDNSFVEQLKDSDNSVKMHLAQVQRLYADIDKEEFEKKMNELRQAVCTLIEREETSLIPCIENTQYDVEKLGEEVAKLRAGESIEPVKLRKKA